MSTAPSVTSTIVQRGPVSIEVLAQGSGHRIVLLPSLGRGATDFDVMAARIAAAGYRVLRPQPRGIGASTSVAYADLQDCGGAALVAGHAFGNRVARMLATARPELVRGVSLIAANVGHAPSTPPIREAIRNSANNALPDEERLKALRFAFFAPGNDPTPWLKGWHPEVLAAQRVAGDKTSRQLDYAGGNAPILYLQPGHDPLAHVEDAHEFKRALGDRVTVIVIDNASHAAIEEQPEAISAALVDFANRLWP
jgi:pimeloyl-ACP methyl ester carboxylesterase